MGGRTPNSAKKNCAKKLSEKNLTEKKLLFTIMNLIHNEKALTNMSIASKSLGKPNATTRIVDHILKEKNDI